jgi:hypothetical protein
LPRRSAKNCATAEAIFSGKSKIVAGSFKNQLQVLASRLLPDSIKARLHRRMLERQPEQRG